MNNLTKRDTFAAAALACIATPTSGPADSKIIASHAFELADAMCALSNQTVEEIAEPIIIAKQRGQIESQQSRIESLESDIRNLADGFLEKDARISELTEALRPFATPQSGWGYEDVSRAKAVLEKGES